MGFKHEKLSASLISTYKITIKCHFKTGENQNIETHFVDADIQKFVCC